MKRRDIHEAFAKWCKTNAPSAYMPSSREFYRDILQYTKQPDGAFIKKLHGYEYYLFTLTPDAKKEFYKFDEIE